MTLSCYCVTNRLINISNDKIKPAVHGIPGYNPILGEEFFTGESSILKRENIQSQKKKKKKKIKQW